MGISYENGARDLFNQAMTLVGKPMPELSIAEFGSQNAKHYNHEVVGMRRIQAHSAITTWFGARHVSFDWNGKHGSIVLDLGRRIGGRRRRQRWMETFDIVTDFGTIEHVERGQYWAHRNAHDLCKPGGYILHVTPRQGTCRGHGFWTYTTEWFKWLAVECNYDVVALSEFDLSKSWKRYEPGQVIYILGILRKSPSELLLSGQTEFVTAVDWVDPTLEARAPQRRSKPVHPI